MKVGFLGFGEVASTISRRLTYHGADIYTSIEGRSTKTRDLARKSAVNICEDDKKVAEISDILISAAVPVQAIEIAKKVGKHSRGVYVDINNVSPQTVKKALSYIENNKTADAAIMGGIKKGIDVQIIASGTCAKEFSVLNDYGMNIKVIGPHAGQASALKMLRSSYTKGVSALLFQSLYAAYQMGLDEEFLQYLEETECPGFRESAQSRIMSSATHARRRAQEMNEVTEMLSKYGDTSLSQATAEFFMELSRKDKLDKKSDNYKDLFKSLKKDC